jgi:hypothetical protein
MDMREARRRARAELAEHAKITADDYGDSDDPDDLRMEKALRSLCDWLVPDLYPQHLSTPVDPRQIALFADPDQ